MIAAGVAILLAVFSGLSGLIFRMVSHNWARMERALEEERKANATAMGADRKMFIDLYTKERDDRDKALEKEREGRKEDRHDAANELAKWTNAFQAFREQVARDHPSYERLSEILKPLSDGIEDIRTSMQRIFDRVDGKMDKRPGGDD